MDVGDSMAQALPSKDNCDDAFEETTTAAGEPSGPTSLYVPRSASLVTPGSQEGSSPAGTPSPVKAASSPTRDVSRSSSDPCGPSTPSSTPSPAAGGEPSPRFALRFVSSSPARGSSGQIDESPIVFDLAGVSPRATAPSTPSSVGVGSGRGAPMSSSWMESGSDSELSSSGAAGSLQRAPIRTGGAAVTMEELNLPSLGLKGPAARNGSSGGTSHPPIRPQPQPVPSLETSHRPPRPGSSNRPQPAQSQRSASSIPVKHSTAQEPNLGQNMRPVAHGRADVAGTYRNRGKTRESEHKMRSLPSLIHRPRSTDEHDHRSLDGTTDVSEHVSASPNGAMHRRACTMDYGAEEDSSKRERRSLLDALRRPHSRSHDEGDTASGGEGQSPSSPLSQRLWQKIGGKDKTATDESYRASHSSQGEDLLSSSGPRHPNSNRPGGEYAQQTKQQLQTDGHVEIGHQRSHQHRPLHDVDSHWPEDPQMPDLFHPPKITRLGVFSDSLSLDGKSLVAEDNITSASVSPLGTMKKEGESEVGILTTPSPQLQKSTQDTPGTLDSDAISPISGLAGVSKEDRPFSPLSYYDNAMKQRDAGDSEAAGDANDAPSSRRTRRTGASEDVLKSSEFKEAMGRKHECLRTLRGADHSFTNGDFAGAQHSYERAVELALARLQGRRLAPFDDGAPPPQAKGTDCGIGRDDALIIVRGISSILVRLGNAHFRQGDVDGSRRAYRKAKKYLTQVIPRIDPSYANGAKVDGGTVVPSDLEVVASPSDESGEGSATKVGLDGEYDLRLADMSQEKHQRTSSSAPFELPPSLDSALVSSRKFLPEMQRMPLSPRSPSDSNAQDKSSSDSAMEGRILNNVASIDALRRRYKSATTSYAQSLRIKRRALRKLLQEEGEGDKGSVHAATNAKEPDQSKVNEEAHRNSVLEIASTLHNIGFIRYELGKFAKAEDAYKQALSLRVEKCGLDDLRVSRTLSGLGDLYLAEGRYDHALRSYGEVLRIRRSVLGQRHKSVGDALHNIGLVHLKKGPYGAARLALADSLRARRDALGASHIDVASTGHLLGLVLTATGELASAKAVLEDALRIRCKHLRKDSGHLTIWNTRLAIGEVERREGQLSEALELFQSVLDGRAARLGRCHPSVAEAVRYVGLAKRDGGDHSAALEAFEEALHIQLKQLGEDSVEAAETWTYLCDAYIKVGRPNDAVEACQQSMIVLKSKLGPDHILYAKSLKCLGDLYQGQRRYDDALKAYHEVMRIRTSWEEASHIDIGDTWNNIGNAQFKKGDFEEAKNAFSQALDIKKKWLDDENVSVFTTLNNLGHAYYKLRDLSLALKTYTESLKNQMARLSGEKRGEFLSQLRDVADRLEQTDSADDYTQRTSVALGNVAATLRNIGLVYQDQQKFRKALEVYERILTVRKAQPIVDYAAIAATAETIGMLHFKLGNHEAAMGAFSESLNVKKMSQGDNTIDAARTLNNLANVYFSSGNLEQAMAMYENSLKIKREILGETHEEVANTLNNIAHVLFTSGQDNRSLEVYNEVLRIRRQKYGGNNMAVASTLATMGDVYLKKGTLNHAKTCYQESATIRSQQQNRNLVEDARVCESLGVVYGKLGDWKDAEIAFAESLNMKVLALGKDHEEIPKTLDSLALALIEQDLFEDAIKPLEDALRIRKTSFSNIEEITALMTKIAYLHKKSGRPDLALQMYADIERLEATEGTGIINENYASF